MLDDIIVAFLDYVIYDEDEEWAGISEDAPQKAKEAYEQYEAIMKNAEENGRVV